MGPTPYSPSLPLPPHSNGPGDPSAVPYAVESVKALVGKAPVLGICMGHQLLGQALGGSTFKMKFGHHGGNHPVRQVSTGRVEISAQNHNYAVDPTTLPEGVEVTHINLNDGTCAGLSFPAMNAMSIQYHPESSPGPHDSDPGETRGCMCGVVERVCGQHPKQKDLLFYLLEWGQQVVRLFLNAVGFLVVIIVFAILSVGGSSRKYLLTCWRWE